MDQIALHDPAALDALLERHERLPLLRFITCGSVDDGKSTLIGRLLHDSGQIPEDQLSALARDSRRHGTQGEAIDYALLVDGLAAEREQGITIDVAWRYFQTARRKFIVADCPGHEQYTRNMATGASQAELAVVLVDASKGLLAQTRRHSWIVALLGIGQVLLAVNKMDLVGYDEQVFARIAEEYRRLAQDFGIARVVCVPMSALHGEQLVERHGHLSWYRGPTLLEALEQAPVERSSALAAFRLPVQWVNRPNARFRGYAGSIASGSIAPGSEVVVLPSGQRSRVEQVYGPDGLLDEAGQGQAVTLTLADQIDISRGDLIAEARHPPEVADQFAVHLLWMDEAPLLPGRQYWLQLGSRSVTAQVSDIRHRIDVNTQEQLAARRLALNEVALCHLSLDQAVPFEPYTESRELGGFILVDRHSHATVACGTIRHALRRSSNIHWQRLDIDRAARAAIKGQQPRCVWFTGLSGSGKSTIANLLDRRLYQLGHHACLLDGDNVRHGLNKDLGFTPEDRVENIRRVAEVARLMTDAGLIVLVSFISPYRAEREMARALFQPGEFIEVHVDTPLEICERRDSKGLYARARAGGIPNFTGIDAPYEAPLQPELRLDTTETRPEELAAEVLQLLV